MKMKSTPYQVASLLLEFAAQYGGMFGMPELSNTPAASAVPDTIGETSRCSAQWNVRPTGQMAAMCRTLKVEILLYTQEAQVTEWTSRKLMVARVRLRYDHKLGGSNGYDMEYILRCDKGDDDEPYELLDFVTKDTFGAIQQDAYANVREIEKKRAAALVPPAVATE